MGLMGLGGVRTWVLCCTLLATMGWMASSRSSFSADAAIVYVL